MAKQFGAQSTTDDVLDGMNLSGKRVLVETHSEMFFHWLRLRAEMNEELAENIAVYFIDRPGLKGCEAPQPVGLVGKSQLHWPIGFFEEAWDIESRIRAIREARGSNH